MATDGAAELDRLAGEKRPIKHFRAAPLHADAYLSLVGAQVVSGPAFTFPDRIGLPSDVTLVDKLEQIERNFRTRRKIHFNE